MRPAPVAAADNGQVTAADVTEGLRRSVSSVVTGSPDLFQQADPDSGDDTVGVHGRRRPLARHVRRQMLSAGAWAASHILWPAGCWSSLVVFTLIEAIISVV